MGQATMTTLEGPQWGPAGGGQATHLVVLLHGVGADGMDLIDIAPSWGQVVPGALFIAPNGPEPCDMAPYGRQWFSLQDRSPAMLAAGVRSAAATLWRCSPGCAAAIWSGWAASTSGAA